MLKKGLRLDRKALNSFFKQKTGFTAGNLVNLRYIKNNLNINRFAVVVSFASGLPKKGRAVVRNLAKRRILEILRLSPIKTGYGLDMVFFVKINSKPASSSQGGLAPKFASLKEDIIYVLHRSRIS